MKEIPKLYLLEGVVQRYSWGGSVFLPALLGIKNVKHEPFAEYWMGAHINAPSFISIDESRQAVNSFIEKDPVKMLGSMVAKEYQSLPYLLKVLDVKDMLSIQVHPDKDQAQLEFEAENKKGVPIDHPARNYKDDNHKPELMLALSEFWLLHGFKPEKQLERVLTEIPELNELNAIFKKGEYTALYRYVMELDQQKVNAQLQPLLDRIIPSYSEGKLFKNDENFWVARAAQLFNKHGMIDRGLYSIYFFNLVRLNPGEGIYQHAGIPHAYLEGQNMEIMANSDNVLRGGLTNKHVAVHELIKHINFSAVHPEIIQGRRLPESCEEVFETPVKDFQLSKIFLKKEDSFSVNTNSVDIYFIYEGEILAREADTTIHCGKGMAILAIAGARIHMIAGSTATIFRATVP